MARPDWKLGYNQGYAAGFDEGYEKGLREGRWLGFSEGFLAALKEAGTGEPPGHLSLALRAMNRAGLFRIVLGGTAAQEAARYFQALGFKIEEL